MKKKLSKKYSPLNLNVDRLAKMTTFGHVASVVRWNMFEINPEGQTVVLPSLGGVVYDYNLGDPVNKFDADHLQPCVTIQADINHEPSSDENFALFTYACIGNEVMIVDRESMAINCMGVVIGKHGAVNYVMVQFNPKDLPKITHQDKVKVELYGRGLRDLTYKDISFANIDPTILLAIPIKETVENKVISFPVVMEIPAEAMGSGLGTVEVSSDYDIMSSAGYDDRLKIGDFVCIKDHFTKTGPSLYKGAKTIAVVVHGSCIDPGHGPGVLPVMTCKTEQLQINIDKNSNLKKYIGR